ncbi:MAG TPA: 50S ribosomal protein L32 [Candidatus Saccharimonadales bacterium]|nr:50S ribosomal protein L32 [Candidatus Saccharimonadales bacterium]
MPCPKRKTSKSRRNQRSANKGLDVQTFTHCPNSGTPVMPHVVCLESGYYKGVKVIATKADRAAKRSQKRQAQQARKNNAEAATSTQASGEQE